jgi:hypothetical protein
MNYKINKRTTILLLLAGGLLFGQLFIFKILFPLGKRWGQQSLDIRTKRELLKKSRDLIKQQQELAETFASLSNKVQAKLPPEREESQFLTEIGNVAQETNMHIASMNPRPFRDLGAFKELSVEIDMEANLGNLVRFLYLMRASSVVLVANELNIQPKEERSALLKGRLVISTIFLKDK